MCHAVRHSIHCILPPQVLKSIVENGSKEEKQAALQTLVTDGTFRSLRNIYYNYNMGAARLQTPAKAADNKNRLIYDLKNTQLYPGVLVRSEGEDGSDDITVNQAYDGLGATFDFYNDVYDRNSIDDNGMDLVAAVHYGKKYDNAFWDGEKMTFGDGDGILFNSFTVSLEVIGHELAHGVTQYECNLQYLNQAGALNESASDVFGSLIKQYKLKQTARKADWLIGEGLLRTKKKMALRSMKAPGTAYDHPVLGKDPQPDHMSRYVKTFEDNGGVHINSGIPNKAFYLAAIHIGGYAWEKAGKIWYETLRDAKLKGTASFTSFASLTWSNAIKLYGIDSTEAKAIAEAWKEVGVPVKEWKA